MLLANRLKFVMISALLLTVSRAVVSAGASTPADPDTPPSGKIVFLRGQPPGDGSVNTDVWIMNPDGSGETKLTTDLNENRQPAISPDSSTIIYGNRESNVLKLWSMESDGNPKAPLLISGNNQAVTWSPDGTKIAYASDSLNFWEVWVADPNGDNQQRLTDHAGASGMPSWSPDMQQLVYTVESSVRHYDLYTTTVTNTITAASLLVSASGTGYSNHWPAWSPDGSEIATIHFPAGSFGPYDLWLMDADGTNGRVLVEDIEGQNTNRLSWSADGQWLVFAKNGQIRRVHRDGTQDFPVSWNSGWEPSTSASSFPPLNQIYVPVVMRDFCSPFYSDDFSNPASGWPIGDNGNIRWEYLNEEYRLLVRPLGAWSAAAPGFKVSNANFGVEVHNPTNVYGTYGLLFGLSDTWTQFYTFEIDPDGYYVIYRYNGAWTLLRVGFSAAIGTGTSHNRLMLARDGAQIRAYVNGQLVTTVSDGSFTGLRRAGLTASSYDSSNVDIRFDDYLVTPLPCPADFASSSEWQAAPDASAAAASAGLDLTDLTHPRQRLSELVDQ